MNSHLTVPLYNNTVTNGQSFVHQNNLLPKDNFPLKTYAIAFLSLK